MRLSPQFNRLDDASLALRRRGIAFATLAGRIHFKPGKSPPARGTKLEFPGRFRQSWLPPLDRLVTVVLTHVIVSFYVQLDCLRS
jgi:hypothetical protein